MAQNGLYFKIEYIIYTITMGIKGLSKVIESNDIKLKDLSGTCIAIDASIIVYKAALGAKNIKTLTDKDGNPTLHINVIIAKCLNFYKHNIKQLWVFDHNEINPEKMHELEKRRESKRKAINKIDELKNNELFSSDDELEEKIHTQERISFTMTDQIIADCKFILDCFNIAYIDSPKNYEAEHICALLTKNGDADSVWTTDMDAIIYGATNVIRELTIKGKKSLHQYNLKNILTECQITMSNLYKIAVVLGCDHCPKTPKVGPKTILKKLNNIELTDTQINTINIFKRTYDVTKLKWSISEKTTTDLINWLKPKGFNIDRIRTQITKAGLSI